MRSVLRAMCSGLILAGVCSPALATQPAAPAPEKESSYEELAALGEMVADLDRLKDNVYVYEEQIAATQKVAQSLTGATVPFAVRVLRVTQNEVFVDVPDAGETRIALKHAMLPEFGNLGTVEYCGPPSVQILRHFARRVALRIGSEIDLEMAKQLRRGDQIVLKGKTESVQVFAESIFCPIALAVISDWEIVSVVQNTLPIF